MFTVLIIGSAILLNVVCAFQLRYDKSLDETNFIKLMEISFKKLILLGGQKNKEDEE